MKKMILLMLLTQVSYAEDLQEGVSYAYPFVYDDSDAFEDEDALESSKKASKEKPASVFEGKMGNADVVIDVGNTDFPSQCHAEWEEIKRRRGGTPKEEKKSEDEKEESHSLNAKFSFKCTIP